MLELNATTLQTPTPDTLEDGMTNNIVFGVIFATLNSFAVFFHAGGLYLLLQAKRKRRRSSTTLNPTNKMVCKREFFFGF